jgi:hypothetical protein
LDRRDETGGLFDVQRMHSGREAGEIVITHTIDGDFDVVFNGSSWNHQHRIVEANGTARQHLPRFESLDHCSTLEGMRGSL